MKKKTKASKKTKKKRIWVTEEEELWLVMHRASIEVERNQKPIEFPTRMEDVTLGCVFPD